MSEQNNIIKTPSQTVIINGGNALDGCPSNWDEAHKWQDDVNAEKESWRRKSFVENNLN